MDMLSKFVGVVSKLVGTVSNVLVWYHLGLSMFCQQQDMVICMICSVQCYVMGTVVRCVVSASSLFICVAYIGGVASVFEGVA